jgi:hypothetical protein
MKRRDFLRLSGGMCLLARFSSCAEGYSIEDGYATASSAPGFGLKVDEDKFASKVKVRFDVKA